MGIASRHAGAPYVNGEVLSGTDLETDINNIFTQVNGGLDNSNIAAGAAIAGTKLSAGSVTGAQLAADTVTLTQLAAGAVSKYATSTATGLVATNTATGAYDVEGLSALAITPAAATDLLICHFTGVLQPDAGTLTATLYFGISINGVDQFFSVAHFPGGASTYRIPVSWHYAAVTGIATLMTIKARYSQPGAAQGMRWSSSVATNRRFSAMIVPIKV